MEILSATIVRLCGRLWPLEGKMASSQGKSEAYNNAVEQAALVRLVLTSSSFDVSLQHQMRLNEMKKFVDQSLPNEPHFDPQSKMLLGFVRCRVWMTDPQGEGDEPADQAWDNSVFSIEAVYGVAFEIPGQHEPDILSTFFDRMAKFATWPYFRSHVSHIATEAGLDVPILPIKKLFHPVRTAGGYIDPTESRHLAVEETAQ